jgi:hypothetical protein
MEKEDIRKALEAISKCGTIAGDLVLEKKVENEIGNVEAGGIGIQIVNGEKAPDISRKKSSKKNISEEKASKPRETMTFERKPEVTEEHLKLLFVKLAQEGWISGNVVDFKTLFSGKRDEDCVTIWLGKYGKSTLVELFQQFVKSGMVILPDGFSLSSILEGHFKDEEGQWLTGLNKGDASNKKALPVIAECIRLLKLRPDKALG